MTGNKTHATQVNFSQEMANFTFAAKYAKYDEKKGRREIWEETVSRLEKMHLKKFNWLPEEDKKEISWAFDRVREKLVAPSMRSLQFGGKAIEAKNLRIYNCSVMHVNSLRSFAEALYLLLCGCGVGFGLSSRHMNKLPDLVSAKHKTGTIITYVVQDDIEGWADSVEALLMCYFKNTPYTGRKIVFDYSKIRAEGTPLKTGGGKAPGYKGLKRTHEKIKALLDFIIEDKKQRRLKTINAYDILMHCADAVLSGGIRRSACSVIFELSDKDMMEAKGNFKVQKIKRFVKDEDSGLYHGKVKIDSIEYDISDMNQWDYDTLKKDALISWFYVQPQRARSNNSVLLYRNSVEFEQFKEIVKKTRECGEPGFVFADEQTKDVLFNPCFEISFIPIDADGHSGVQVCNLTTQNGGKITSKEIFKTATKAATIIGTLQAAYTDFEYLSNTSKEITEKEALLGVSITGMMDNPAILLNPDNQREMAEYSKKVNEEWAKKLGISPCARTTCIKPEGTSSIILETASGIHPAHAKKYIRRIQCNKMDPVYKFIKANNPHACEESVWSANKTDDVVSFPITSNPDAMVKSDLTAIKHLEIIKSTQQNWVIPGTRDISKGINNNVSCTVIVGDNEWEDVQKYIYDNKEYFTAVALIPNTGDKLYKQAPNEAVTTQEDEVKFEELMKKWKSLNFKDFKEEDDNTKLQQEAACAGGGCEVKAL